MIGLMRRGLVAAAGLALASCAAPGPEKKPGYCEVHDVPLIQNTCYRNTVAGADTGGLEVEWIRAHAPHHLPSGCSMERSPVEGFTQPVKLSVCPECSEAMHRAKAALRGEPAYPPG